MDGSPPGGAATDLSRVLRLVEAAVPRMLLDAREMLVVEHPDYAAFLDAAFEEIHACARRFAPRLLGLADGPIGLELVVFEGIGSAHHREGLDITGLLAAYRTGALVAWRHVAAAAGACGTDAAALAALAGSVFRALDELSSASLRGYLGEASASARTHGGERRELAELILAGGDRVAVAAAARRAGWPVPELAALVLTGPEAELDDQTVFRLGGDCLRLRRPDMAITIVPGAGDATRADRITTVLAGAAAVIGPTTGLDQLAATLPPASLALRLHGTGASLPGGPIVVTEHLDTLLVHHDRRLLADVRAHHLAPLAGLPAAARDRLIATLSAWLRHMGSHREIAAELHIHPRTVRYRLRRLHELFGAALRDPAARAGLTLALAWPDNPPSDMGPNDPEYRRPGGRESSGPSRPRTRSIAGRQ